MSYTIDASVLVASARAGDIHHRESADCLQAIIDQGEDVFCPTLVLPECSAAISRSTGDESLAQRTAALIERFPRMHLVALDVVLARRAVAVAWLDRLRGADAVYVTVAEQSGSTIVTLDAEMLARSAPLAPALTPAQWLTEHAVKKELP